MEINVFLLIKLNGSGRSDILNLHKKKPMLIEKCYAVSSSEYDIVMHLKGVHDVVKGETERIRGMEGVESMRVLTTES